MLPNRPHSGEGVLKNFPNLARQSDAPKSPTPVPKQIPLHPLLSENIISSQKTCPMVKGGGGNQAARG